MKKKKSQIKYLLVPSTAIDYLITTISFDFHTLFMFALLCVK